MTVNRAVSVRTALSLSLALATAWVSTGSITWAQAQPTIALAAGADTAAVGSTAAQRDAALERIRQERNALLTDRKAQEAECYRKFAVEDCLRGVRASTRGAEALLRAQEIDIKDAERKEKAAERQRAIAEKLGDGGDATSTGKSGTGAVAGSAPRKAPADKAPTLTLRDADAARRAQEQRSKLQERSQAENAVAAGAAARESKARAEYAEKLRAAEERRSRLARSQAEEQAAGKKPGAPLPESPASR